MNKIKGTGVALVTPFNDDKSIDYKGLEKLLEYVISGGVNYCQNLKRLKLLIFAKELIIEDYQLS